MSEGRIQDLQRAIRDQGFAWKAGPTPLSVLGPEEQVRHLGLRLEATDVARITTVLAQVAPVVPGYPPAWDWRTVGGADWTTPVRDQGQCGSCVAISVTGVMETMLKQRHGDPHLAVDLSEAHLFFCGCGDCCDKGWWPSHALDYAQKYGVPEETVLPYQDSYVPCPGSGDTDPAQTLKVVGWQEVLNVPARKAWLAGTGPMVACLGIYEDLMYYVGGVYRHVEGTLLGYHAVCVVGYSEAEQAWIAQNSWGPQWGEAGWFRIGYGECGIDSHFAMYGVTAVAPGSSPIPEPVPVPVWQPGCNAPSRLLARWRGRT